MASDTNNLSVSKPMVTIRQITNVQEILGNWQELLDDRPSRYMNASKFLAMLLHSLDGALFFAYMDGKYVGYCSVEVQGYRAIVHSLPVSLGHKIGLACLNQIKRWAKKNSIHSINITTTKFSGSTNRYFEETLGLKREAVIYSTKV